MKTLIIILLFGAIVARADWQVASGYRIEEYAREPRIVDPVAMDWGDGRTLHVLESGGDIKSFGAPPKVIASGLEGATGIAIRGGKIFVARPPELLVLDGTNLHVLVRDLPEAGARG